MKSKESLVGCHAELRILDQNEERVTGQVAAIDAKSARLQLDRPLPVGTPIEILLDDVVLLGEVRGTEPVGTGYAAVVDITHTFTLSADLLRLASQLQAQTLWTTRDLAPEPVRKAPHRSPLQ